MTSSRFQVVAAACVGLSCLAPRHASADHYYVSQSGNDTDPGTSRRPWATLQRAADQVQPGDTVIVLPGTYRGFNLSRSGSASRPIRFSAMPGVVVNIAAAGTHRSRIFLENASYIVIEGFEIVGTNNQTNSKEGIKIDGPVDGSAGHIVIRRNHIHHNGDRNILTGFASHLTIEDNVVHHAAQEHGIYVSNSGDTHVIRRNRVYANAGSGIQINADASLGGDGVITDALVEHNVIYGNGGGGIVDLGNGPIVVPPAGSAINCDGVQRSVFRANVLYDNHASGISLYRIDGGEPSQDNLVADNIIINAADGRFALNIQDASSRNTLRSNVLFTQNPASGAIRIDSPSLEGLDSDRNLLENHFEIDGAAVDFAAWRTRTGGDQHSSAVTLDVCKALSSRALLRVAQPAP